MATLEKRTGRRGTTYRIVFWINGKRHSRTLEEANEKDAKRALENAEERLRLYLGGKIEKPAGADLAVWIATDGRVEVKPTPTNILPLGKVFGLYAKDCGYVSRPRDKEKPADDDENLIWEPAGETAAIEPSTLLTVRIHLKNASRILGAQTPLGSLTFGDLQSYINRRGAQRSRQGNKISPVTIRKEIVTLSGMWSWAASHKKVKGGFPGKKLKYPATTEVLRFQTWQEIERQIKNGAPEKLWDCLFLSTEEIGELLPYAAKHAYKPYVYPMLLTAAHTGARRSELMRSQAEDIDFKAKILTIRERKRERGHHGTRSVPMSPLLVKVLKKWLAGRTSGPTFCTAPGIRLTRDDAHSHLELTLADGEWSKVKGWHTFRHSMASNLAAKGIDQRVINEILGHVSEQTAARYRHFAPNVTANAVQSVFG